MSASSKSILSHVVENTERANAAFDSLMDSCHGRKVSRVTGKAESLDVALARMAETIDFSDHPAIRFHDKPEDMEAS